jgi:hypothetical protein
MKKSQKNAKKSTLAEAMQEQLTKLSDARQDKIARDTRERYRAQEDEVMAMTYGPNWRDTAEPKGDEEIKQAG